MFTSPLCINAGSSYTGACNLNSILNPEFLKTAPAHTTSLHMLRMLMCLCPILTASNAATVPLCDCCNAKTLLAQCSGLQDKLNTQSKTQETLKFFYCRNGVLRVGEWRAYLLRPLARSSWRSASSGKFLSGFSCVFTSCHMQFRNAVRRLQSTHTVPRCKPSASSQKSRQGTNLVNQAGCLTQSKYSVPF